MIEFDVDMGYLLEAGELDCVILNDENGEYEPMKFTSELGSGTCEWLYPQGVAGWLGYAECSNCGYKVYENTIDEREWTYCPSCGRQVKR